MTLVLHNQSPFYSAHVFSLTFFGTDHFFSVHLCFTSLIDIIFIWSGHQICIAHFGSSILFVCQLFPVVSLFAFVIHCILCSSPQVETTNCLSQILKCGISEHFETGSWSSAGTKPIPQKRMSWDAIFVRFPFLSKPFLRISAMFLPRHSSLRSNSSRFPLVQSGLNDLRVESV